MRVKGSVKSSVKSDAVKKPVKVKAIGLTVSSMGDDDTPDPTTTATTSKPAASFAAAALSLQPRGMAPAPATTASALPLSPQQRDVVEWTERGHGNAFVQARAGSGKTHTLIAAARTMYGSVAYAAFNKKISEEVKHKLDGVASARVGTFHSFGFGAWRRVAPHVTVNARQKDRAMMEAAQVPQPLQSAVRRLVSIAKQSVIGVAWQPDDRDFWMSLIDHHSIPLSAPATRDDDRMASDLIAYAVRGLHFARENGKRLVDFDDMLWLPLVEDVSTYQNDWVLVDECFLGDTPVLLDSSGQWAPISDLVESGYRGCVLSWDEKTGETVRRRVTGHKRVLRDKPMKQIRFVQRQPGWSLLTRKVRLGVPIVVCTEDHRIKTLNGWVAAKDLRPGDTVYMETAQGRVGSYQDRHKISAQGKTRLAPAGNTRGVGNRGGSRESFNNVKGGNGRVSPTEVLFFEKVAEHLPGLEFGGVIRTQQPRGSGYPTHYKVDFIIPSRAAIIEIDGNSHRQRVTEDARKDELLSELGYSVTRITNDEVQRLTAVELVNRVFPGCFVEAEVVEVNDYTTAESYVYDLEVEGTHCYFAHGLLVHNCQDTNVARRLMVEKMMRPNGRALFVGDVAQSIYGFSGADANAVTQIIDRFNCTLLPLTVTFRCSKAATALAQRYVPDITAHPNNRDGSVENLSASTFIEKFIVGKGIRRGDAILCRNTRPLVDLAFRLIRAGIGCHVEGRDIGNQLEGLAKRWGVTSTRDLIVKLTEYQQKEAERLMARDASHLIEALNDRVETLMVLMDGVDTVEGLCAKIYGLFVDTDARDGHNLVTLSTIHRYKGREADRVFILGWGKYMPSKMARKKWELEQEGNLSYVAITRSRDALFLVEALD